MAERESLWIDPYLFDWPIGMSHSIHCKSNELVLRAYEIHEHAEKLLGRAESALDRVDVVTTLKRAIDHRLRTLDETYKFKEIPIKDKPDGLIDVLGYLGVARPFMVHELLTIRNLVEHQDESPPGSADVRRLVELVWYFLRSTDVIVYRVLQYVVFEGDDSDDPGSYLELNLHPPDWRPSIVGWLPPQHVSKALVPGWANAYGALEDAATRGVPDGRQRTGVRVEAELRGPGNVLRRVVSLMLGSVQM